MIVGSSPRSAISDLRAVLQSALSCVSPGVFVMKSEPASSQFIFEGHSASTVTPGGVTLYLGHRFALANESSAHARERWRIRTSGYRYELNDTDGREILAYHWHPEGRSRVTMPHLHLGAAAGDLRGELVKAHIITGLVTPVALLLLVIERFGVRPRRRDWAPRLSHADQTMQDT